MTITTTVSSKVLKDALFKGSALAILGILTLTAAAIFLPAARLQESGSLIFFISILLIAVGLIPYRQLSRLQLNPSRLSFDSEEIHYFQRGKKILTIPLASLSNWNFIDDPFHYGMTATIQKPPYPLLTIYYPREVKKLRKKGAQLGADLFFPFFNRRSYEEWMREYRETG